MYYISMSSKSYKYPELNDKSFLETEYVIKGLSTKEIARKVGAKRSNSVRQALIRHGIKVRNSREAQVFDRREDHIVINRSFIDGGLLGDAYLQKSNKNSLTSCPFYARKQKHEEYIRWCGEMIGDCSIKESKDKKYWQLRTKTHDELQEFYLRWYPESNGYKKRVPRDLFFDKEMLLVWFLDDGSTSWRSRAGSSSVLLSFSSESFSRDDNEYICNGFNRCFDLGFKIRKCCSGSGWRIHASERKVNDFFEILGASPVECYSYKWKLR